MAVKIKDLLPAPRVIEVGEHTLEVRGLRLDETIKLLETHKKPLSVFFGGQALNFELLIAQAPDMVAEIIGMTADAVGQEEDIKLLPIGTQVEAITAVWELSVPSVKKLLESLRKVSSGLAGVRDVALPVTENPSP